jgi:hypothetical protein
MRPPVTTWRPVARLLVRTRAVIVVVDDATGRPPSRLPAMRLQRLGAGGPVEPGWRSTVTLGGAVVFDGFMDMGRTPAIEHYRLIVEPDAAVRPERRGGYAFTIGNVPDRWPVRLEVRLLPGPAYPYPPRLPVVRGMVLEGEPGGSPIPDAVVTASEDGGATVAARCGADHRGSFSLGIPRYRASRAISIRATAPGGAAGAWRLLTPSDFQRSVQLTVRR